MAELENFGWGGRKPDNNYKLIVLDFSHEEYRFCKCKVCCWSSQEWTEATLEWLELYWNWGSEKEHKLPFENDNSRGINK